MDPSQVVQLQARAFTRAADLAASISAAGHTPRPQPALPPDPLDARRALDTWVSDLTDQALRAGIDVDTPAATPRAPAEMVAELDRLRAVRVELLERLADTQSERDQATTDLTRLRVAYHGLERRHQDLASDLRRLTTGEDDLHLPATPPAAATTPSTSRLLLDTLTAAGRPLPRRDLVDVGLTAGLTTNAIDSALRRLRQDGQVVRTDAGWSVADDDGSNVVPIARR